MSGGHFFLAAGISLWRGGQRCREAADCISIHTDRHATLEDPRKRKLATPGWSGRIYRLLSFFSFQNSNNVQLNLELALNQMFL